MADWQTIKTEYITTDTSYRKLAKKYDVTPRAICHRSQEEGWLALRQQYVNKTTTRTLEKISKQEATRAAKVFSVADKLLQKIDALADNPEPLTEKSLRALTASVKDLKEILGVRSAMDEREQKARIANLERQSEPEGKDAPTLTVEGLPEEFKV